MIVLHIPDIRAIRLNVSFVIPYADFITNFTNDTNFNRLFFGKLLWGYYQFIWRKRGTMITHQLCCLMCPLRVPANVIRTLL